MRKYFQALTLWMPLCGFYVVLMASCEKYTDEIPNINGIRIKEYISPSSDNDSFDTLYFYYDLSIKRLLPVLQSLRNKVS